MDFDQDLTGCAGLVQRGDPERFRAVMAAPVAARAVLFPLYALNVEVARAPWVTGEAMIAEMRLQWWLDALGEIAEQGAVRRHEVVTPLAAVLPPELAGALAALVAARRWDIYRDPFEDAAAFDAHLDATAGSLLWVAARALGPADEGCVRDLGYAQGLANWLRAVPALEAQGRIPLVDGRPQAVQALARSGLARLARARAGRGGVSRAAGVALLAAWQAGPVLARAVRDPMAVAEGRLEPGPLRASLRLAARALLGRW